MESSRTARLESTTIRAGLAPRALSARRSAPGGARATRWLAAALLATGAGCSSDAVTTPDGAAVDGAAAAVGSVRLTPAGSELGLGNTLRLRLTALDAAGNELPARDAVWASQDTLVAAVAQDGVVAARRIGVVQVQAVVQGKSAYAVVNVVAARVAAVAVTPAAASVAAGGTAQLSARVTDASGAALGDRFVFWQSSNDAVARVTSTGLVSGVAAGTATITATSEGRSATSAVTVTGAAPATPTAGPAAVDSLKVEPADTTVVRGASARLRVRVFAGNQAVSGRAVTWSTSSPATLRVDAATGEVTALAPSAEPGFVNAAVEGRVASATVKVVDRAVATVGVSAERAALLVGESTTLRAALLDGDGGVVGSASASWRSDNPAVLSVTSTGPETARVTALAAGAATVSATAPSGASGGTRITVTSPPAPVATTTRVDVTPSARSLAARETVQLTATPVDASGAPRSGRAIAWASSDASVASVSDAGLVTAVRAGSATITATADGVSGSAAIEVTAPPPPPVVTARVEVTPSAGALRPADRRQLAATPFDAGGSPRAGRPVAWSSSAPGVATVNDGGLVTAVAPGSTTVSATIDGVVGSTVVVVEAPPPPPAAVASVEVAPAAATVVVGGTRQLAATPRDAGNGVLTGRAAPAWTSSNAAVATVNAAGLVTAVAPGAATITATIEGVQGRSAVTVTAPPPAPVARVDVTPATASVVAGGAQQLAATTRDAAGTALAGRTVVWTSSNPAVATVSGTGLVTAVAPGSATITATAEGVAGAAAITVTARPVARVQVAPSQLALALEGGAREGVLTATPFDASGATLGGRSCTWSGGEGGNGRNFGQRLVDLDALTATTVRVRARREGTATVVATCEGVTATATVTVRDDD